MKHKVSNIGYWHWHGFTIENITDILEILDKLYPYTARGRLSWSKSRNRKVLNFVEKKRNNSVHRYLIMSTTSWLSVIQFILFRTKIGVFMRRNQIFMLLLPLVCQLSHIFYKKIVFECIHSIILHTDQCPNKINNELYLFPFLDSLSLDLPVNLLNIHEMYLLETS